MMYNRSDISAPRLMFLALVILLSIVLLASDASFTAEHWVILISIPILLLAFFMIRRQGDIRK